jgi:hypothetical protein
VNLALNKRSVQTAVPLRQKCERENRRSGVMTDEVATLTASKPMHAVINQIKSAMGQNRKSRPCGEMSAPPPTADIAAQSGSLHPHVGHRSRAVRRRRRADGGAGGDGRGLRQVQYRPCLAVAADRLMVARQGALATTDKQNMPPEARWSFRDRASVTI